MTFDEAGFLVLRVLLTIGLAVLGAAFGDDSARLCISRLHALGRTIGAGIILASLLGMPGYNSPKVFWIIAGAFCTPGIVYALRSPLNDERYRERSRNR